MISTRYDYLLKRLRLRDEDAAQLSSVPLPDDSPGDGEGLFYDVSIGKFVWASSGAGAGLADEKFILVYWHESVSGTSGILTPPANGSIVLDLFADAVDALAFETGSDGKPSWVSATEADGTPVSLTLDAGGNWSTGGQIPDPAGFSIVYAYRVKLKYLDYTKMLSDLGASTEEVAAHEALYDHTAFLTDTVDGGTW
jgi:hypothetical protein